MRFTKIFGNNTFEWNDTEAESEEDMKRPYEECTDIYSYLGIAFHMMQQNLGYTILNGLLVRPLVMDQTCGKPISEDDIIYYHFDQYTRLKSILQ